MQIKISAFFKPCTPRTPEPPQLFHQNEDASFFQEENSQIQITYKRRAENADSSHDNNEMDGRRIVETTKVLNSVDFPSNQFPISSKILNKKRNYAQFHLDLGQSDFLLHTCSTCEFKYARGDEEDEKVHNALHKNYTHGIPFKGWRSERIVHVPSTLGSRIILVLDGDSPAHRKKVQEVVERMEMELGSGGLLIHKLCKVYLYVSSQRVAGSLIAEPIKAAYRILSRSVALRSSGGKNVKEMKSNSNVLRFGDVNFQGEVTTRVPSGKSSAMLKKDLDGAIFCKKEAVPAPCGIRAIWVAPYNRRKHVASHLLEAARKSFCMVLVLKPSDLAFSQLTSAGKALASSYTGMESYLAYKTDDTFELLDDC